jgi:NADH dehydrogenase/NADH:ubiquinone oxidoreductase subunit G
MVVSPDLTNEGLYTAQKFVRSCLKSNSIDSTARWALPGGIGLWARLFSLPISIKGIAHADSIIAVGLDSRFSFSVAGVEIRRALREGATLVTIDSRDSNLARYTGHWLQPSPGREGAVLRVLAEALIGGSRRGASRAAADGSGVDKEALDKAVKALASGRDLAVVVGPAAYAVDSNHELGEALLRLAERERTTFLPLFQGANTRGALELGVFGELLPGLEKAPGGGLSLAAVLEGRAKPKVLYLVGETPFFGRPDCEYVIAQDIYRPPFEVDAFLPAASFAEAEGTLTNVEGRVQEIVKIEDLPDGAITGFARPDWFIFGALTERLLGTGPPFKDAREILKEISGNVAGFPASPDRQPRRLKLKQEIPWDRPRTAPSGATGYRLIVEPGGFRHRGIDMSFAVEGLSELGLEEGFRLHPDDMDELGVESGDQLTLSVGELKVSGPAKADADCPRGTVHMFRPLAYGGVHHRRNLEPLFRLQGSPVKVEVAREGEARAQSGADPYPAGQTLNRKD